MIKITKSTGDVQYSCISDFMIWNCRYFEALAKGETPPVKDRLEFQLGQPMERPLTQGLLAVLHKQVSIIKLLLKLFYKFIYLCIYFGVLVSSKQYMLASRSPT